MGAQWQASYQTVCRQQNQQVGSWGTMVGIVSDSLPAAEPTGWELGHNGRHRISQLAGSRTMGWEWGHNGRHLISQLAGGRINRLGVGATALRLSSLVAWGSAGKQRDPALSTCTHIALHKLCFMGTVHFTVKCRTSLPLSKQNQSSGDHAAYRLPP